MPRPKMYRTKAEHREAQKAKSRRHYAKHRDQILESKREKRDKEQKALELQEIANRKWRQKMREKMSPKTEKTTNDIEPILPKDDIASRKLWHK
ncbi:hypothetical protein PM082_015511 [Marasmius tenuissimus]|nr:hypothetical protein PM082_015511 [Marasmius tenuissimus]